jgi:primary-amine oxidase
MVILCYSTCVHNGLIGSIEYALYYYFYQDGTIGYSIRLTGVLNTYILAPSESSAPFGTTVAPQITAHYHQHIFSLRLDPMIDGVSYVRRIRVQKY